VLQSIMQITQNISLPFESGASLIVYEEILFVYVCQACCCVGCNALSRNREDLEAHVVMSRIKKMRAILQ